MRTPVTFKDWVKSSTGKIYVGVSGIFAVCFSVFQALKLFGVERIPIPKVTATDQGWLIVNYSIQVIFITYVVLITAYRFVQIKDADKSAPKEKVIWENLELYDPTAKTSEQDAADEQDKQKAWIGYKLKANKVIRQFTWFWLLAWFSWLFHYGYLFLESLGWITTNQAFRNFLNNTNSLMFIFLFMTLTVSTSRYGPLFWGKLLFVVFLVYGIEWAAYKTSGSREGIALSFSIVSGLFASVALAAFVGSIDSKFLNVPIWLIPALYLYAGIQSLYIFFELEHVIFKFQNEQLGAYVFVQKTQIVITIFTFILKTLLFITVTWILRSGRLVYFMIEEGSLNYKKDKNFATFLDNIEVEEARLT